MGAERWTEEEFAMCIIRFVDAGGQLRLGRELDNGRAT